MASKKKKICGIVMPISECDGRSESHWADVLSILKGVAVEQGYETRLVSDTFESNLIHKEILQNIYQDDIVICDVSGRNPNVFFELGIRMATQKPTVIIKDDKTSYPFDTGPNRYVGYPRDLRHPEMEKFKAELEQMMSKTIEQSQDKSFIGQLGPFHIPDVESTTLPASDIILDRLDRIERQMSVSRQEQYKTLDRVNYEKLLTPAVLDKYGILSIEFKDVTGTQLKDGLDATMASISLKDIEVEIEQITPKMHRIVMKGPGVGAPGLEQLLRHRVRAA